MSNVDMKDFVSIVLSDVANMVMIFSNDERHYFFELLEQTRRSSVNLIHVIGSVIWMFILLLAMQHPTTFVKYLTSTVRYLFNHSSTAEVSPKSSLVRRNGPGHKFLKLERAAPTITHEARDPTTTTTFEGFDNTREEGKAHRLERARIVAKTFVPGKFEPIPSMSNCHIQTIVGLFTRHIPECRVVTNMRRSTRIAIQALLFRRKNDPSQSIDWDWRETVETPDADVFYVDHKNAAKKKTSNKPFVATGTFLLLHGLESSSESPLAKDFLDAIHRQFPDWNVACINFRGCCPDTGPPRGVGGYHLGFTDDIKFYLETRRLRFRQHPSSSNRRKELLFVVGYSLGGNVALKAMGELGVDAVEKYNIIGAGGYCVPLNNEENYPYLAAPGFNRTVYTQGLLSNMKAKARYHLEVVCKNDPSTDLFDFPGTQDAKTVMEFDEAFVCRYYGFESFVDYYRKNSSIHFLKDIVVPTLILNSADDPFMSPHYWPEEYVQSTLAPIRMVRTHQGGHVGHMFQDATKRRRRRRRTVENRGCTCCGWHRRGRSCDDDNDHDADITLDNVNASAVTINSFGPSEMARFLHHTLQYLYETNGHVERDKNTPES